MTDETPIIDDIEDESERELVQAISDLRHLKNREPTEREVLKIIKDLGWVPEDTATRLLARITELEYELITKQDEPEEVPNKPEEGNDWVDLNSFGGVSFRYSTSPNSNGSSGVWGSWQSNTPGPSPAPTTIKSWTGTI